MKPRNLLLIAAILSGLFAGAAVSEMNSSVGKCEQWERDAIQKENISGSLACFPPGVIAANQSEEVKEGSELECVCRRSLNGSLEVWAISRSIS
jgi:hypothetical protein